MTSTDGMLARVEHDVSLPRAELDRLRFGISLPNRGVLFGVQLSDLLEIAEIADRSNLIESVWVGDNLTSKPRFEAIVLLSAIAARTQRVRLGTICMASFPLRHPIPFALQWASLDRLSDGRTILAVCSGGSASMGDVFRNELEAMGIRSVDRIPRLEEGVEVIRRLWAEERLTFDGKFHHFHDIEAQPKPIQAAVPVLIAVNPPHDASSETVERALRRVAKLGDGWQTDGTRPKTFESRWRQIRDYAAEYGRTDRVTESVLHLMVNINENAEAAKQQALEFLDKYYGASGDVSADKLDNWLAVGAPGEVAARIRQYVDAGCTTPVIRLVSPDQVGQLGRLLEEVIPLFNDYESRHSLASVD